MSAGSPETWTELARSRLTRILGPDSARMVFDEVLGELEMTELASANDLLSFADRVARRGGFLAAVGTALGTLALLRGAKPR